MNSPDGQKLVLPKGRTIPIDGDVVRTARLNKGLSHIQMSSLTDLSTDRLIEIEKGGQNVYPTSFLAIAKALGYEKDWRSLVQGEAESSTLPEKSTQALSLENPKKTVEIKISGDSSVNGSMSLDEISFLIKTLVDLKHDVVVTGIRKGSIIVQLELSEDDLLRLVAAFSEAKLDIIKVEAIHLPATDGALAAGLLQIIEPDKKAGEGLVEPVTPEMTLTRTPTKPVAFSVKEITAEEIRRQRDANFPIFLLFVAITSMLLSVIGVYFCDLYAKQEHKIALMYACAMGGIVFMVVSIMIRRVIKIINE